MSYTHTDIHTLTHAGCPSDFTLYNLGPHSRHSNQILGTSWSSPYLSAQNTREADQGQEAPQQPLHGQSMPPMLLASGFTLLEKMSLAESSATRSPRFFASRPAPSCMDLYPRQWGSLCHHVNDFPILAFSASVRALEIREAK